MAENQELLDNLRLLTKQMNLMLAFQNRNANDTKLAESHKKAKEILNKSKKKDESNEFGENKSKDPSSVSNNKYIRELIQLYREEKNKEKNSLKITLSEALSSPINTLKKTLSPSYVANTLSSTGSYLQKNAPGTVTGTLGSLALKTPGFLLNTLKKATTNRKVNVRKKLEDKIDVDNKVFSLRESKIKTLDPNKDSSLIKTLTDANIKLRNSIDSRLEQLGKLVSSEIIKRNKEKTNLLDTKEDKKLFKDDIKSSVISSFIKPKKPVVKTTDTTPKNPVFGGGQLVAGLKSRKEDSKTKAESKTIASELLSQKIPISSSRPSSFAETIGGIYYSLMKIADKEDKPQTNESGGIFGLIGGALAGLAFKFRGIIGRLLPLIGRVRSGFSSLVTGISKLITKLKSPSKLISSITGMFSKAKDKIGSIFKIFKIGSFGRGTLQAGVKEGTKVASKSLLKKLPVVGALIAGGFGAAEASGTSSRKATVGTSTGIGSAGGALAGLATGAAIGSVIPGAGTAVGAVVGLLGSVLGSYFGEKLGKTIGENVYDEIAKGKDKNRTNVSNTLTTDREIQRTKDLTAESIKAQEIAMYNALTKHGNEDLDRNGRKRAMYNASALADEANK